VIILVVVTIGVLWWVGYQKQNAREAQKQQLAQTILAKQKNLEQAVTEAQKKSTSDNLDNLTLATPESLKVVTSSSTSASLRQYGLNLAQIFSFLNTKRANEVTLTLQAIDNNNQDNIKALLASRIKYETASNELSQTTVPVSLEREHRALIVNTRNITILLKQMERALEAPQTATLASRLFLQESVVLFQNIDKVNNYFVTNKVNLTDQEKPRVLPNFN
jgi:hypothetical protein